VRFVDTSAGPDYTQDFEADSNPPGSGDDSCSEIGPDSVGSGFNCDYTTIALEGSESVWLGSARGQVRKNQAWTGTEEECVQYKLYIDDKGSTANVYVGLRFLDPNGNVTYQVEIDTSPQKLRLKCGGGAVSGYEPVYSEDTTHTLQVRMDHSDGSGYSSGSFNLDGGGFTSCTGSAAFPSETTGYYLITGHSTQTLILDSIRTTTGSQTCE
jgi:hypothetical protein